MRPVPSSADMLDSTPSHVGAGSETFDEGLETDEKAAKAVLH
jgi:hypothetical protein